jgi:hypothetical protein
MEGFIRWVSNHTLTTLLIAGTVFAVWLVISNRKQLFYKE